MIPKLCISGFVYCSDILLARVAVDNECLYAFKRADHVMMIVNIGGFQPRLLALQPVFCEIRVDSLQSPYLELFYLRWLCGFPDAHSQDSSP